MSKPPLIGKILRVFAIVLLGLTVTVTLLGGIGSTCAAFNAEAYESMAALVPFKWLYQILVVLNIAAAVYGIYATVALVQRKAQAYRSALVTLVVSLALAATQMTASQVLRGKSMPNDMRVYIAGFSLVVFLLLRLPGVWERVGFTSPGGGAGGTAAGLALFLSGATILTAHLWAGPTHTFGGINFADAWHAQLAVVGWALLSNGVLALAWLGLEIGKVQRAPGDQREVAHQAQ